MPLAIEAGQIIPVHYFLFRVQLVKSEHIFILGADYEQKKFFRHMMRVDMQNRLQRPISCNTFPVFLFTSLVGCITPGHFPANDPAANVPSANNNSAPAKKPAEGQLSKEEVEGVIRSNLPQIKACYDRALQTNPNLKGRVMTSFEIGANGKVSRSEIANSTLNHPPTEQCVAQSIKQWRFPIPRGGGNVRVTYPFTLGSK